MVNHQDEQIYPTMVGVPVKTLKELEQSLVRAVEEGSDLQLGIVIGQVIAKLNQLTDGY